MSQKRYKLQVELAKYGFGIGMLMICLALIFANK